jgi:hypothetical protein
MLLILPLPLPLSNHFQTLLSQAWRFLLLQKVLHLASRHVHLRLLHAPLSLKIISRTSLPCRTYQMWNVGLMTHKSVFHPRALPCCAHLALILCLLPRHPMLPLTP